MGLVHAEIELINPRDAALRPLAVRALVDTGAITLCIPEHVALQLGLAELERREVQTADGRSMLVPYVGPIQVRFGNRNCFTGALVLGDAVLLGAVPLEDMDLVIDPRGQEVTVNPASPNIPSLLVKRASRLGDDRRVGRDGSLSLSLSKSKSKSKSSAASIECCDDTDTDTNADTDTGLDCDETSARLTQSKR